MPSAAPFKSKTLTALLAFLGGSLGLHRFYLYGRRDAFGWLHLLGLLLGLVGLVLLWQSARASVFGWCLAAPGLVSIVAGCIAALVYGLRPDEKWDARFNPAHTRRSRSGWPVVLVVMAALFVGTCILMAALALLFQTYFEYDVARERAEANASQSAAAVRAMPASSSATSAR